MDGCVLLLLLFLLKGPSLLHQVSIETGLVSLLLFEIDASDETTTVEMNLMFLFISKHTHTVSNLCCYHATL